MFIIVTLMHADSILPYVFTFVAKGCNFRVISFSLPDHLFMAKSGGGGKKVVGVNTKHSGTCPILSQ